MDISENIKLSYCKNKSRKRKKKSYQRFIREETNIFESLSQNDYSEEEDQILYKNTLIPRNEHQQIYYDALNSPDIPLIIAIGPAGTGKSLFSCNYAITNFLSNLSTFHKIVITRPVVSVDEEHGFLPGDINQKMKPWLQPIYDIFEKYISLSYLKYLIQNEHIEICPLAYMRGRTFDDTIIIADEMQNATNNQFKMLLTRIGNNSKMIINGDLQQIDNTLFNGLNNFIQKYNSFIKTTKEDKIKIIQFDNKDTLRSPILKTILNIYNL
jgi:phosphate starvation-inducible PhoH-like protein